MWKCWCLGGKEFVDALLVLFKFLGRCYSVFFVGVVVDVVFGVFGDFFFGGGGLNGGGRLLLRRRSDRRIVAIWSVTSSGGEDASSGGGGVVLGETM